MKNIYKTSCFLIFILIATNSKGQGEWLPSGDFNLPDGWGVSSISIVNEDTIWASAVHYTNLNFTPKIYQTTDGGVNWEEHEMTGVSGRQLYTLVALNGTTALVTTNDNDPWYGPGGAKALYKTTDGGNSWEPVLQHNAGGVHLYFFDDQNGICANQDDIAYTENGGDSWTIVNGDSIPDLNSNEVSGSFISTSASSLPAIGDTVWMGTDEGRILRSINKGKSWQIFDTGLGNEQAIFALAFSDSNNGLIGYNSLPSNTCKLARTTDGGESWVDVPIPPMIKLREIIHVPGTESTFVGASYEDPQQTAFLSDYGNEWIILDDTKSIAALTFSNINSGWSSDGREEPANNPEVYKWEQVTSTFEAVSKLKEIAVFPNPFETELTIQSEELLITKVSLFNADGKMLKIQNDLNTNSHYFSIPNLFKGIYFLDIETSGGRIVKKIVK